MTGISRISISAEGPLLEAFEKLIQTQGYPTRSEAIKDLMRQALTQQEWQKGKDVAGTISIVYDHHKRGAMEKLVGIQHDFGDLIVCTQHVHLDHHNCMEVIVVRGSAKSIQELLKKLNAIKGLKHSSLMMVTADKHNR